VPEEPSPADEARLRRLLARSRHDEPLPADVTARLDDVLARLDAGEEPHDLHDDLDGYAAAARASSASTAAPAPLRRHRRGLSLLVAAAAVVVAGIGVDQVLDRVDSEGDAATASAEAVDAEVPDPTEGRASDEDLVEMEEGGAEAYALDGSSGDQTTDSELSGGAVAGSVAGPGDLLVVDGRLTTVREGSFADVAERLQRRLSGAPRLAARAQGAQAFRDAAPRVQRAWQGCTPPEVGTGTPVAVLYDGSPAVLVLRPAEGATQVAALLQCDTGEVLRSVTLPVG
jgi:hypothetical protein